MTEITDLSTCSTKVENGAMFHETTETSSVSNWQQASPFLNIKNQLFKQVIFDVEERASLLPV